MDAPELLSGRKLTKHHRGGAIALQGVDVDVVPGSITALIGPSGAGKTTLIKALSFLDPPDSGEICLGGTRYAFPLPNGGHVAPWPRLTVVFQQLFLWPHLSLYNNITLPLKMRQEQAHSHDVLNELLDLFEMREFIHRYPNQVSLGQRQRAALVRALVLNPKYVLLDEITSALDVEQVTALLGYLQVLRSRQIGILIVTHLLNFARRAADNIIFMDKGQALETGGPEMLEHPESPRLKRFLSIVEAAS